MSISAGTPTPRPQDESDNESDTWKAYLASVREEQDAAYRRAIAVKEALFTCRGPCPFTSKLPTEVVVEIAKYLDKTSFLTFRATGRAIASQVPLNTCFETVELGVVYWGDYERLKRLRRSEEASKVKNLEWIETKASTVSKLPKDLQNVPSLEEAELFPPLQARQWLLLMSPLCFKNLKSLKLYLRYDMRDVWDYSMEDYSLLARIFDRETKDLRNILDFSCDRPLKVYIEHDFLFLCTISWAGNSQNTTDIILENDRDYSCWGDEEDRSPLEIENEEDLDELEGYVEPRFGSVWHERALIMFVHYVETNLLNRLESLRLYGFRIRTIDLDRLCGGDMEFNTCPPKILTLHNCTLLPRIPQSRIGVDNPVETRYLVEICSQTLRELSLLNVRAKLSPEGSWTDLFYELRKGYKSLQSFRFEKVQNVFFDWDGNGQLDDGQMLPSIIEERGLKEALTKMIECYRYVQPENEIKEAEQREEGLEWSDGTASNGLEWSSSDDE